jgi:adhesin transport system outer membrane protein
VEQQVAPSVEAELSRSRSLQAQSDLVSAQAALETARFRFEQWVGDLNAVRLSDDKPSALDEGLLQQAMRARPAPLVPQVILPQLQLAIDRYPTLWRIDADIDAAAEDVRLKQAELLPTVYVRLDRQFSDNPNTTLRMADTVAYMGLQYTMGAGLSLRSQVEVALAKLQGMHGDRETARREVKERFESEWREYRSALQRLEQADLVLQSSIGLLVSYERLFVVGRRTWLELLNAVKEVGFAEQARHELQAQIQASHYRLRVYLGELPWQQGR